MLRKLEGEVGCDPERESEEKENQCSIRFNF